MATKKLTTKDRSVFAFGKVVGASKWIVFSGTATYFLSELIVLLTKLEIPSWGLLLANFVVNVLLFGISKYIEGKENK